MSGSRGCGKKAAAGLAAITVQPLAELPLPTANIRIAGNRYPHQQGPCEGCFAT
ncbi:hypothetical protein [Streptomyces albogriseolus]|uniref:hypothetical protein n=1 Tax=Streptomyces albogriseolus TaxID=1887 RepID=UPI0036896081